MASVRTSMKSPCATVVPAPSEGVTTSSPGSIATRMALATIAPSSWAMQYIAKRMGLIAPIMHSASETLGLNRPPVTRKNIQAAMRSARPSDAAIKMSCSTEATALMDCETLASAAAV